MTLTLYTYDWLPEFPRGFVRDMRVRWVLEELGRSYVVKSLPASPKSDAHLGMQPFGQVPIIKDQDLTLFESGAILLHLGAWTDLIPKGREAEITQWLIAALNTVEVASAPWLNMKLAAKIPQFFGPAPAAEVVDHAQALLETRLSALDRWIADRAWLTEDFSVADIAMVDVLRVIHAEDGLSSHSNLTGYVQRGTDRSAFRKAMKDHMAHWKAADARCKVEKAS